MRNIWEKRRIFTWYLQICRKLLIKCLEINGGVSENQMGENGLSRFYSEYRGIPEVDLESMTFLGMVSLFKQDCIWVQC